jgi:hypothetical protein
MNLRPGEMITSCSPLMALARRELSYISLFKRVKSNILF